MSTQDGYNDVSQAARDSLPTPTDSAMTAARLEPKRLAAIRDFAAKDAYYNNDLATELLSHIDAVEAERTKLAADLARVEGERDRINDAAMLARGAAIEACNEMDAAIARALAAEAKSARLEEALREIEGMSVPDQPAAFALRRETYLMRWVAKLRAVARAALTLPEPSHET